MLYNNITINYFTNTQEVTTHSAAPSKCIHSGDKKIDTDRTSTGKQNITSKHHTTLLHTFICRHPHAIFYYIITNTQEATTQSAAPSNCINSSTTTFHVNRTGTNKTSPAGTLQQPMLVSGHTHAGAEPRPTGLCKHSQTRTIHEEIAPTQPNAKLTIHINIIIL
jgi:hypothetical protein